MRSEGVNKRTKKKDSRGNYFLFSFSLIYYFILPAFFLKGLFASFDKRPTRTVKKTRNFVVTKKRKENVIKGMSRRQKAQKKTQ